MTPDGWGSLPELDLLVDLIDTTEEERDWQERAVCAETDPEAFFPEKGGSTGPAKRICLGCEVKDQCLEYAIAHQERFGIWGGLSERERRKLKNRSLEAVPVLGRKGRQIPAEVEDEVRGLLGRFMTIRAIALETGVSEKTVRRVRDRRQNGAAA